MKVRSYAVVIEPTATGYSAYVPDLPGCVSTGRTLDEIERNMREAIELHLEGMVEDGDLVPEPSATVRVIEADSAA
jgi:predicted RNase H-like HicB family nuclease